MKFYTLDNQLIEEMENLPINFTGIIEHRNGSKIWYFKGKRHRDDGPAGESFDGTKVWWIGGKRHRLDGPAYVGADGSKGWWVDDKLVTEEQCKFLYSIMKLKGLL